MRVEHKDKNNIPTEKEFVPVQPMNKIVILFVMVFVSTALFWLAWHTALTTITFSFSFANVLTAVSTLLAFCLMFAAVALSEVLITKRFFVLLVVVAAPLTGFLFFSFSPWTLIAALLMSLGWLYWRRAIKNDMKTRTKFDPQKTMDASLRGAVAIMLLASSIMYYGFLVNQTNTSNRIVDGLVDTGIGTINFGLERFYGDAYNPEMTLDAFIANITRIGELEEQGIEEFEAITPEIEELDAQIKAGLAEAEDELVKQGRQEFLNTFDIEATGDTRMEEIAKKIATQQIQSFVTPYQDFIPALLALSLFFVLNIVSVIYREVIKLFSKLLYIILKWLKFIKVTKVQAEIEKITL